MKIIEEIGWFLLALLIIGAIWFFNGGANRATSHEGAFIKPLAPLDSGNIYGNYYQGTQTKTNEQLDLPEWPVNIFREAENFIIGWFVHTPKSTILAHETSVTIGGLIFDGLAGAKSSDPDTEYVRIIASPTATSSFQLSGLIMFDKNSSNQITIPKATDLAAIDKNPQLSDIIMSAGGRALVSSGKSPIGYSFRLNECIGYLNETSTYVPALPNACPDGSGCKSNPSKKLTYANCVSAHKNDSGFYLNEWRVFLGQSNELWNNSNDTIELKSSSGNIIDVLSY